MRLKFAPILLLAATGCAAARLPAGSEPMPPIVAVDEPNERNAIMEQVHAAMARHDFATLNAMERAFRGGARTSSGSWKLTWFYHGFEGPPLAGRTDDHQCVDHVSPAVAEWARVDPHQPAPYIAQAVALNNQAWCIRGNGYADEVTPEASAAFDRLMGQAGEVLEAHRRDAQPDPHFHTMMINVAIALGASRPAFDRLLDEAIAREPYYYETWEIAVHYLMPRWHGQPGDVTRLARLAAEKMKAREGSVGYAKVFFGMSDLSDVDRSVLDWPTVKAGLSDLIRTYPTDFNVAIAARTACGAGDRDATAGFLKLTPAEDGHSWKDHDEWASCRAFALGGT